MRIRSLAPLAVAVALGASAFATVPAQAATNTVQVKPETFAGGAAARALDLSILGQKLTLGDTVANIVKGVSDTGATTLLAKAVGTGQLSLLGNTTATSSLTSNGSQNSPSTCAGIALPELISSILSIGVACGSSSASIADGLLNSVATGQVGDISLSVNNLLKPLGLDQLASANSLLPIGSLLNNLTSLTSALNLPIGNLAGLDVGSLLDSVLNSVLDTKTLQVTIGDAKSTVTNTVNTVTAASHSAALDIKILPLPILGGIVQNKPLLEVVVGEASASATYDRLTGLPVGDPKFSPAIVCIQGLLTDTLGLGGILSGLGGLGAASEATNIGCSGNPKAIKIALGQELTLLAGTPLESTIKLGSGKIVDDGEFGKKAVADGVGIELLKGISGGIVLNLAHAEAGAISKLAQTKVLDIPALDISRDIPTPTALPRTGAETTVPLALAGIAVAMVAARRFRMAAAAK